MKTKLFILAGLCAIAFTANAQTEKGKKMLGGTLVYSSATNESGTNKNTLETFEIEPSFGYFVSHNFALGLTAGFGTNSNEANNGMSSIISKTNYASFGVFGRKYVDLGEKFKFFAQLSASYQFGKQSNSTIPGKTDHNTVGAGLNPGFAFFPTNKLGLQFAFGGINYTHVNIGNSAIGGYKADNFTFDLTTVTPNISINYHF